MKHYGFLVAALAGRLCAHDLYLMPDRFLTKPGAPLRVVFQNGDEFPKGTSAVKPERLRNTRLVSQAGTAEFTGIAAEAKQTVASVKAPGPGLAILTSSTLPGFIELDAVKFKSYLEHENLTNAIQWREKHGETGKPGRERYSKYVKSMIRVDRSDGFFAHKTGLTIEIVPEADPYSLKPGQNLPVQVLFRGQPAVDVAVESAWLEGGKSKLETIGRTDGEGRIQIPVKAAGPHRLHAIAMERCADPKAAGWESFWASLTFEIQTAR
jgi:hypothetical protein